MDEELKMVAKEYWTRVHDMCYRYNTAWGTDIKPWECVKENGLKGTLDYHPWFVGSPRSFELAIGVLHGTPVFKGDVVLGDDGRLCVVPGWPIHDDLYFWSV